MQTEKVNLSEIDLKDEEFLLFDSDLDSKLEKSISKIGLINPVKLLQKRDSYCLVTGWKRVKALNNSDNKTVYSHVLSENDYTREQILEIIYLDNRERISDIEKAELLKKLADYANNDKLIKNYLPLLGLNPSISNLNKYISAASLDSELKYACFNELLTFEQLNMLSEIGDIEIRNEIYGNLFKRYKFNNNESRELIKDIQLIRNRDKLNVEEILKNIIDNSEKNPSSNDIRAGIKKVCYPKLTEIESLYKDIIKDLKLSKTSRLVNHPYFESNELELRIRFGKKEELLKELENLKTNIKDGRIERLLNLIKEGV